MKTKSTIITAALILSLLLNAFQYSKYRDLSREYLKAKILIVEMLLNGVKPEEPQQKYPSLKL